MRTRTTPLTSVSRAGRRRAAGPQAWSLPKTTLVSTCPNCGRERPQHGYTRRVLSELLKARHEIDAYCIACNVCWRISESERRTVSSQ